MEAVSIRVFVSYSRADQGLVTPIVQIIRAVGVGAFQDIDSISYGSRWRRVIESSIDDACTILVFWCKHSEASEEVRKEWGRAIQGQKDVIPVILDDTPLDPQLAEYQGIDLRAVVPHHSTENRGLYKLFPSLDDLPEEVRRKILGEVTGSPDNVLGADATALVAARVLAFLQKK